MIATALLIAYPVLVHAAVLTGSRWLTFAALASLIANAAWPLLRRTGRGNTPNMPNMLIVLALLAIGVGITQSPMREVLFYAAPILVLAAFLYVFANSLRPGQTPVATRAAEILRGGTCPPRIEHYTRAVTIYWCVVFTALIVENIALALLASPAVWSLFANGGNYVVAGLAFAGEIACRRIVVDNHDRDGVLAELFAMRRIDWLRAVRGHG